MRTSAARLASRAVGCADHACHEVGRVPAPLMPFDISGPIFSISCRKRRFAEALLAFRWATAAFSQWPIGGPRVPYAPGTVAVLRGVVAHGEAGP